jgi:cytochrome c peroxidase
MRTPFQDSRCAAARLPRFLIAALVLVVALIGTLAGCSGADLPDELEQSSVDSVTREDGLAEAYGVFKALFTSPNLATDSAREPANVEPDLHYTIGFGFHPGLSTTKIVVNGNPVRGQAIINFAEGTVTATLLVPSDGTRFDLYFVKNALGKGTVKPESFDRIFKVGSFVPTANPNQHALSVNIGTAPFPKDGVNFDLDMVVITLHGKSPTTNVVATGARTLFEKRFFRERAGAPPEPVSGRLADFIETNDPLVQRGAELFVNEAFGGNGRRCATCHPLANNQTIDPAFVATLPASDPLFHFPAGLEDAALLKHGLIRENIDGFEQPTLKFVERGVPHTLSMSTSVGEVGTGVGSNDSNESEAGPSLPTPPDQRGGWSGDGSPGRGTLNEFAFGAIVQHFAKSLARVPGQDFRIPTQAELDALEAFQMFNGRQKTPDTRLLGFADPAAEAGALSANREGQCLACHQELIGLQERNSIFDTGVENLRLPFRTASNMPRDGGAGSNHLDGTPGTIASGFGNGAFNAPPLFEFADTPPFFHNGAISTVEDAVAFYQSPEFLASRATNFAVPTLTPQSIKNIGGFLRTLNALVNMAQVRKRAAYLENNATTGGSTILKVALRDIQDAIDDLSVPALSAPATVRALNELQLVKQALLNSRSSANDRPASHMGHAIAHLATAKSDLLSANPNNDF